MADIECIVDGMVIDVLNNDNTSEYKFVVEVSEKSVASIYVAPCSYHLEVCDKWGLDKSRVKGGGTLHVFDKTIKLSGYSGGFGSIPNSIAERFGEVIVERLRERGIEFRLGKPRMFEMFLKEYWKEE